jgi:hypothetical protein
VWDLSTRVLRHEWVRDGASADEVVPSPDATKFAVCWDGRHGAEVYRADGELLCRILDDVSTLTFTANGDRLIGFNGKRNGIVEYAVEDGLPALDRAKAVQLDLRGGLSPASASARVDSFTRGDLRQTTAGGQTLELEVHKSHTTLLVQDAHGEKQAEFEAVAEQWTAEPSTSPGPVHASLAVSPDGRYAITCTKNEVTLWRLPMPRELAYVVVVLLPVLAVSGFLGAVLGARPRGSGAGRTATGLVFGGLVGAVVGWTLLNHGWVTRLVGLWPAPVVSVVTAYLAARWRLAWRS